MNDDRREDREALKDKPSRIDKAERRLGQAVCDICPPHRGENRTRRAKHGDRKPRYKNR